VRALWSSLDSAWNARDAKTFSRIFTEDASFEFVDRGRALDSRAAVLEYFSEQFPGIAPELRHRTTIRQTLSIAPDVLCADGIVEIQRIPADASADLAVLRTFAVFAIMAREVDGLRIRALRIYALPGDGSERPTDMPVALSGRVRVDLPMAAW
jgi:uncharacterized protein (TIGR02246 family)